MPWIQEDRDGVHKPVTLIAETFHLISGMVAGLSGKSTIRQIPRTCSTESVPLFIGPQAGLSCLTFCTNFLLNQPWRGTKVLGQPGLEDYSITVPDTR